MAVRYSIDGLDEYLRALDKGPAELLKASKAAMRKAAKATERNIRARIPDRWRRTIKSTVGKSKYTGRTYAEVGLMDSQPAGGNQPKHGEVPDLFKAYWQNYGTLEGRDPSHEFVTKVKHGKTSAAKARRNRTGISHRNFFEEAIEGWEETFTAAFDAELDKQLEKIL